MSLPPGQHALDHFPRFGLTKFANRFPSETRSISLKIGGDVGESLTVSAEELRKLRELPCVEQTSDFHCVTTWSRLALRWRHFWFD